MKMTEKALEQKRTRLEEILEFYQGMSLADMETILWMMSDRITIPHAFNDGVTRGMEVESICLNGCEVQINTNIFANHCDNLDGNNETT